MDGKNKKPDNKFKKSLNSETVREHWQSTVPILSDHNRVGQKGTPEKNEHRCLRCGKLCKTMSALNMHFLHKHPDFQIEVKCVVCDKIYDSVMSLLQHVRYKHRYNHRCTACNRNFTTADQLSNHKQCCNKREIPYGECGKICDSEFTVHNHYKYKHPGSKNNYCCDLCQCKFTSFNELSKHMAITHSLKSEPCNWYDDSFNSLQSISNKNRYHCGICKSKFNSSTAVVQHVMKMHTSK